MQVLYYKGELKWNGGRAVERRTVKRDDGGSIPPTDVSKLRQFRKFTFGRDTKSRDTYVEVLRIFMFYKERVLADF